MSRRHHNQGVRKQELVGVAILNNRNQVLVVPHLGSLVLPGGRASQNKQMQDIIRRAREKVPEVDFYPLGNEHFYIRTHTDKKRVGEMVYVCKCYGEHVEQRNYEWVRYGEAFDRMEPVMRDIVGELARRRYIDSLSDPCSTQS